MDLPTAATDTFKDDDSSVFEGDIEALGSAGITRGCNPPTNDEFCPGDHVTRGQMAAFLVRAFGYTDDGGGDRFLDDDGSVFESDIDRLGTAGVTKGCNPPLNDRFCPRDVITRAEMASLLGRALGLSPIAADPGLGTGWSHVGVQDPGIANATLTAGYGYAPWGYDPATLPIPGPNTHHVDNTATT
ncbi:MAG: S-layer homology domain-containing protein, partial [Actinomycetia bacterium]|nr:S-layer homology domain-containing protein [Actinomycetes bacterium]